jgi:hypothetical protein
MDDSVSSTGTCSPASITSSYVSSSSSSRVHQLQQTRQQSFTHVFPASLRDDNAQLLARERSSAASRAALRELLHPTPSSLDLADRSKLLNKGLHWLREAPISSHRPHQRVLSQEAITAFNSEDSGRAASHEMKRNDNRSGSWSTKSWLDDQNRVRALSP